MNEGNDARKVESFVMLKPHIRGFDKKRTQQFIYQQDGFSATLDKILGIEYSDKVSIRNMRDSVYAQMKRIIKEGRYSYH